MAAEKNGTRIPQQRRSVETKERILKSAEELFSSRGYYITNSKEIAERAGAAVGSFYAYFKDKKAVLMQLLEEHNRRVLDSILAFQDTVILDEVNPRGFFVSLIENAVRAHDSLPDFHRDISILIYSDPGAKVMMNRFKRAAVTGTKALLAGLADRLRVKDIDAAAVLVTRVVEDTVHGIRYDKEPIEEERLISELADMLLLYLVR